MNENTLEKEFENLYLDLTTILPDKIIELVHEHYYPHASPHFKKPLTHEALNAIKEIHDQYTAAVASIVGYSSEEMKKYLENLHRDEG